MDLKTMLLENDLTGCVAVFKRLRNDPIWKYAGYIEIEIMDVNVEKGLVKLKFNTTLKTYYTQGDIEWVDINNCLDFEFMFYLSKPIHG